MFLLVGRAALITHLSSWKQRDFSAAISGQILVKVFPFAPVSIHSHGIFHKINQQFGVSHSRNPHAAMIHSRRTCRWSPSTSASHGTFNAGLRVGRHRDAVELRTEKMLRSEDAFHDTSRKFPWYPLGRSIPTCACFDRWTESFRHFVGQTSTSW